MKVIDSTPGNRAISFKPTELLTSQRLSSALHQYGRYSLIEAREIIAQVFDALENQLSDARPIKA